MWKKYILLALLIAILVGLYFYKSVEGFALSGETLTTSQFSVLTGYVTVFLPSAVSSIIGKLAPTTDASTTSLRTKLITYVNTKRDNFNKDPTTLSQQSKDFLVTSQMLTGILVNGALRKCGYNMRLPLYDVSTGPTTYNQEKTPKPGGRVMTPEEYLAVDGYMNFYLKDAMKYAKDQMKDNTGKGVIDTYMDYLKGAVPTSSLKDKDPVKSDIASGFLPSDIMTNIYVDDVVEFMDYIRTKVLSPLFTRYNVAINLQSLSLEQNANTLVWSNPVSALDAAFIEEQKKRAAGLLLRESPSSNANVSNSTESQLTNNIFKTLQSYNTPESNLSLLDLTKTVDIFGLGLGGSNKNTSNAIVNTSNVTPPVTKPTTTCPPVPTCASLDKSNNSLIETPEDCPCVYEYFRPGAMV